MSELFTLTRPQGNNRALIDGSVTPAGYPLRFADVPVLVKGFRKMVRKLEYDVSEMAFTTYLTRKGARRRVHGPAGLPGPRLPPRRHPGAPRLRDQRSRPTSPAGASASTGATP